MLVPELVALSYAAVSILILLLLLFIYLVIRKVIENTRRANINLLKEKLSPLLLEFLTEDKITRNLRLHSELKMKAAEEVLTSYSAIIEGEKEKENLFSFTELHLKDYYAAKLKSRKWSKRMNALYHIEGFRLLSLQDDVLAIAQNPRASHDERVHSLRILASFQYAKFYTVVTGLQPLADSEYRNILMRLNEKSFEQFILGFHHCHEALKWAILDVIAISKELKYTYFVEKVFAANEGEIQLRAIKALSAIGYVKDLKPYLPLCQSGHWQQRMMVAKLFGSLKDPSLLPILLELLHDASWYVRSQAGQSIMMFPDGKAALQNVLNTSQDNFARDMAWEWMIKGDLYT
ncbi:HEAT repeat domain-containing protein [Bacillus sp. S/N-304-OC-R1]|uniref:HEAT repeat domain-containing protein n=1 Tax=Bacillus sp. S/N-304-OC-R1 TaxID=2758034 RepID=UPI001C8EC503|nr:HEAT repeat domain-containing protein [Bacillus sp. S/N-304-OC-R1]MBY0123254.1 hypothetical protein [Bacillus sp. S/N-304-OC-R1]